jgi:stress-induced morphogen
MSAASGGGDAKGESAADVAGGVEVTGSGFRGPMWADVARKLLARFDPVVHAEVHNESHMHNVAEDSETHLKVVIVSDVFQGVPLLARHRQVNELLAEELAGTLHALSIHAKTRKQWEKKRAIDASPACMGGSGK